MLRCALARSERAFARRQHDAIRCLSTSDRKRQNTARLRAMRQRDAAANEGGVNYRYRRDGKNQDMETLWGEEASQKKNFFTQVDERQNHQESIASFFKSLGDAPPAKPKSTAPPVRTPPPRAAYAPPPPPPPPRRVSPPPPAQSSNDDTMLQGRSIFDAFPVPEAPPPVNPNLYDEEAYQQYRQVLDEILESSKFLRLHTRKPLTPELVEPIRQWLQADEPTVEVNLPLLQQSVQHGISSESQEFENQLQQQRQVFLEKTNLTERQYEIATNAIKAMGRECASRARSLPLDVAWEKIKEAGMVLDKDSLHSILYACSFYAGKRTSFSGDSTLDMFTTNDSMEENDKEDEKEEEEEYIVDVPEEIATFNDLLREPTEQSVSIRVKSLVAKGNAEAAEALLNSFTPEKNSEARQRTYLPVLRCYLDKGVISSGLRLFKQMRDTPSVLLESETYIHLISAVAENGYLSNDSEPIEGAEELGYPAHGPELLDKLVTEMAEDVLEITSASARRLYTAFENKYRGEEMARNVPEIHPLAPLSPQNDEATDDELIASRVLVASETGVCPRSRATLRLINLEMDERKKTQSSLLKLAGDAYEAWQNTRKRNPRDRAVESLAQFADWLDKREGEPFTAVVDGANAAYYMQNFEQGKFNVHQIQFIVNALEGKGENPLVILPFKYCFPSFRTSGTRMQHLNQKEIDILKRLTAEGKLYRVPKHFLDDYYWMMASVSDQIVSRGGKDLDIPPDDPSGKWPGARPMLITNDQMRDHKLELLEPRLFRRWYSSYIVNYNFTAFVDDECVDREISFTVADFFSREIQGNPTSNGTAWHFPVSDWEPHERFCLRVPKSIDCCYSNKLIYGGKLFKAIQPAMALSSE